MKNTVLLTLAVGATLLAGCSSPVRTLEYRDGKLTMTEEPSGLGPPRKWELKQVSSTDERDNLRKAGWKQESVITSEGGNHTFLMKRKIDGQIPSQAATARPPFHPVLITTLGTNTTGDGSWRISASESSLDLSRSDAVSDGNGLTMSGWETTGVPGWKTHTGWFVFAESESRVWAYNGDRLLWLNTETASGNNLMGTNYVSPRFPCAVPAEVFSRLSDTAQKAIPSHE